MDRLTIELSPSPLVTALLAVAHLGAFGVIFTLTLTVWLKFLLTLPVFASLCYTIAHHGLKITPHSIKHLQASADNYWLLTTNKGDEILASLRGDSVLSRPLLVLNFELQNSPFHKPVIICANNKDQTGLRRLRAWVSTAY